MSYQSDSTLPDRKHEQHLSVVVTKLIVTADNAVMHHGDPHYSGQLKCFSSLGLRLALTTTAQILLF